MVSPVVKVILVPWQILFVEGLIETVGVTKGFTTINALVLVAVPAVVQEALLVITTHTESLLFKAVLEYELVAVFCFELPLTKKL